MPSDHASWKKRCKEKCRSSERTCDLHVQVGAYVGPIWISYFKREHALREVASYSIYAVL